MDMVDKRKMKTEVDEVQVLNSSHDSLVEFLGASSDPVIYQCGNSLPPHCSFVGILIQKVCCFGVFIQSAGEGSRSLSFQVLLFYMRLLAFRSHQRLVLSVVRPVYLC